jgi:5'-phosphate synthase pdxT subunit
MVVGVLALQGGFAAHAAALTALGHRTALVRSSGELAALDGLVLPGGESTVMLRLIDRFAMADALDAFVRSGRPVLATCAGLIVAARRVTHPEQASFGWLDVTVARNAWGRQRDSFEWQGKLFIRAPKIVEVGAAVDVLEAMEGEPVLVRQGNVTAATFHPELGSDRRLHGSVFRSDPAGGRSRSPSASS